MSTFIYPYKAGSNSAKTLRDKLGAKLIKLENSKFTGSEKKVVINWGNSTMNNELLKCKVVNNPNAVAIASNKLTFFDHVKNVVQVPPYTTNQDEAEDWIREGAQVLARATLTGSGGSGITALADVDEWELYDHSKAKVYTKYIRKKDEYRIHVMGGEVIDMQRKALASHLRNVRNLDWRIRNHDFGFVFVREGVEPPQEVIDAAVSAVGACGLDFGAVDVIWNNYYKMAYVLEVNTAPGLEGQTVENYIKGLEEIYLSSARKPNKKLPTLSEILEMSTAGIAPEPEEEEEEDDLYYDDELDEEIDDDF